MFTSELMKGYIETHTKQVNLWNDVQSTVPGLYSDV